MSLSSLSNISSSVFKINISPPISEPTIVFNYFVFPNDLNVGENTITTHTYNYTGATGANTWKNGKYLMMSKYSQGINAAWNMFTLSNSNFFTTGIINNQNHQYIYDPPSDTVIQGSNLLYTRDSYLNTKPTESIYIGGTTTTSQNVSTTYNGTLISQGEYFEVRFPFPHGFIFEKLFISLANTDIYGPRDIRVVGSNDGITWTQVHFQIYDLATYTQNVMIQVMNLTTNTQSYKSHRIIFEKSRGLSYITIGQCRIEGKAGIEI